MANYLQKELCIVGSGFCGYAAYKKLLKSNHDLILVEGGNFETPKYQKDQDFYKINQNKLVSSFKFGGKIFNIKNLLDVSFRDRKFTLGGSSECWSGWIKPMEKSTFNNIFNNYESQNWEGIDLSKFENESSAILNSPIENFDPYAVANSINLNLPILPKGLDYTVYAWAESPLRLKNYWSNKSTNHFQNITDKKNVLYSHKLIDVEIFEGKIDSLIFENNEKDILKIKAKVFIIALGGIENARFIKKLNEKSPSNISNKNIIGNFQEHPHLFDIAMFNYGKKEIPEILKWRIPYKSEKNGSKGKIKFAITAWDGIGTPKVAFEIKSYENKPKAFLKSLLKGNPYFDCKINMRCEQSPNKSSNLQFNKFDTKLNWNVSSSDFKYYSNYLKRFISFLRFNEFIKDFQLKNDSFKDYIFPMESDGGAHHMGTVPLTQNSLILDKTFRHSIFKNIYVVGSSSFPTSGFENPTHTAIATTLAAVENIEIKIK